MPNKITYHIESLYMGKWGHDTFILDSTDSKDRAINSCDRIRKDYPDTEYRVVKNTTEQQVIY